MRINHIARRNLLVPVLGLAVAATMTACSSSSSSSSSSAATSPTAATSSAAPATSAAAAPSSPAASPSSTFTGEAAAIEKNWETFFNGSTPAATKAGLVQNGQAFLPVLEAQAKNPQGATASASVQSITLTSSTQASVVYTILVSGTPMLTGQKGTAVLENGTWKVGVASFCALAALQAAGQAVPGCPAA
jgi:hypothetical protein